MKHVPLINYDDRYSDSACHAIGGELSFGSCMEYAMLSKYRN